MLVCIRSSTYIHIHVHTCTYTSHTQFHAPHTLHTPPTHPTPPISHPPPTPHPPPTTCITHIYLSLTKSLSLTKCLSLTRPHTFHGRFTVKRPANTCISIDLPAPGGPVSNVMLPERNTPLTLRRGLYVRSSVAGNDTCVCVCV